VKKFVYLLMTMVLLACSDSENVAYLDDFSDFGSSSDVLAEASSSSVLELSSSIELSSSTENANLSSSSDNTVSSSEIFSSSSSEKGLSSSSSFYIPLLVEIYLRDFVVDTIARYECDSGLVGISAAHNYYKLFVDERVAKLSANATPSDYDRKRAVVELLLTLGMDSLFQEVHFTRFIFEYTLNLFLSMDSSGNNNFVKSFSETGTIDRSEFCNLWMTKSGNSTDETSAYGKDLLLATYPGFIGCAAGDGVPETAYKIFNNMYRMCIGLPFCNDNLSGVVKRAGLKNVIRDTNYVCQKGKWVIPDNYGQDTRDVPCDKIGKMFKSPSVDERYYVCQNDGWNMTTKIDYETRDSTCPRSTKIMQSPTDTNLFYFCKNSQWSIAKEIDIDTIGQPCDRVGKILKGIRLIQYPTSLVPSGTIEGAYYYYYCDKGGWRVATYNEANIGEEPCDLEGKTVRGKVDSTFLYTCYKNKWVDFYNAPCDTDNKRLVGLSAMWQSKSLYICYNGAWHEAKKWSCEYPKDYYFNPNVEYGTLTDERDGESYRTVEFNGYTWMAENLRYITPDSSQSILFADSCEIGGRFYSKEAARTACPAGWKLPDSTVVYSLFAPNYNQLSADEQTAYFKQFMSEIGSFCATSACNTYGTTFFSFGTTLTSNRQSGPNFTYFWAYNKQNPDEPWQFGFDDNSMFYSKSDEDVYMPIRCIKE